MRRSGSDRNISAVLGPACEHYGYAGGSSASTYGRIGNAYGRIDILGHGIGRIERHLSSSCGSGIDSHNSRHHVIESLCGPDDGTGRISKVSLQWLLVNKWLPLWIANNSSTGGRDYRIIDFLLGHRNTDYDNLQQQEPPSNEDPTPPNSPS